MSRHFVRLGGRLVHYRRWGEGPAVLLLHGSPQSSRAVEALAHILAEQGFCAIAPDTPGNGLSAPLSGQPLCQDYARALAEFADILRLGRVGLYGFHTGASIACAFAALYPARVTALVLNGLSAWSETEIAELPLRYLPSFQPAWDGSHLAWLWARLEEHTVFFPWYDPVPSARMTYDVPALEATHASVLDFLDSGDNYRAPYAAAFAFRTEDWLHQVKSPFLLATTGLDPLRPHLTRRPLKDCDPRLFDDPSALFQAASSLLARHPGDVSPSAAESGDRGFSRGIAWRGRQEGSGRPLILLHDAGGSSRQFAPMIDQIADSGPVLALDLPGHGESAQYIAADSKLEIFSEGIAGALQELGIERPAIAGFGFGATVADRLAAKGVAQAAARVGTKAFPTVDPVSMAAPSLLPEWDGAHLLRAFRIARWERLFSPWYRRDRHHAKAQGDLDPVDIHARALDLLKAGSSWAAAVACERIAPLDRYGLSLCVSNDPTDWHQPLRDLTAE